MPKVNIENQMIPIPPLKRIGGRDFKIIFIPTHMFRFKIIASTHKNQGAPWALWHPLVAVREASQDKNSKSPLLRTGLGGRLGRLGTPMAPWEASNKRAKSSKLPRLRTRMAGHLGRFGTLRWHRGSPLGAKNSKPVRPRTRVKGHLG